MLRLLGPPVVRLLRVEDQVLVLEQILPGAPAAERPDDEALAAVAATLLALWVPVPRGAGSRPCTRSAPPSTMTKQSHRCRPVSCGPRA